MILPRRRTGLGGPAGHVDDVFDPYRHAVQQSAIIAAQISRPASSAARRAPSASTSTHARTAGSNFSIRADILQPIARRNLLAAQHRDNVGNGAHYIHKINSAKSSR